MLPSFLMILIELAKMAEPLHDEWLVHSSHWLFPSLFILLHRNALDWVLKCTLWSCFNANCQLLSLVKSVAMNSRLMGKLVDRNGEVMFEQKPEISYSEKYFSFLLICMCNWAYFICLGALEPIWELTRQYQCLLFSVLEVSNSFSLGALLYFILHLDENYSIPTWCMFAGSSIGSRLHHGLAKVSIPVIWTCLWMAMMVSFPPLAVSLWVADSVSLHFSLRMLPLKQLGP